MEKKLNKNKTKQQSVLVRFWATMCHQPVSVHHYVDSSNLWNTARAMICISFNKLSPLSGITLPFCFSGCLDTVYSDQ